MEGIEDLLFDASLGAKALKMAGEALDDDVHAAVIIQLAHEIARNVDTAIDLLAADASPP